MTQPVIGKPIEVRLFATLRINREKILYQEYHDNLTVAALMASLDISVQDVAILLVNGRDAAPDRILVAGDVLSLFPPVGGG